MMRQKCLFVYIFVVFHFIQCLFQLSGGSKMRISAILKKRSPKIHSDDQYCKALILSFRILMRLISSSKDNDFPKIIDSCIDL